MKSILFFLLLILSIQIKCSATHIFGGELYYSYIGNNNYKITLVLYRDCYNGVPPFDNPVSLGVFNGNNTLVNSLNVNLDSSSNATNTPGNCISTAPFNICFEKGIYIDTVNLPPATGGYTISYQRCCRQSGLINVDTPNTTGLTVFTRIPDSAFYINSSPVFFNEPFKLMCANTPFTFDNSAFDADNDSISYSLITPVAGASNQNPMPNPPAAPPYPDILWSNGYSIFDMFGGTPLSIDPVTGVLSANPNTNGIFAYALCAKEYRNGIFIGQTTRNFTTYVILTAGIAIPPDNSINIFPNPVHRKSVLKFAGTVLSDNTFIKIFDSTGKNVFTSIKLDSNEFNFHTDDLSNGIYYYQIISDNLIINNGQFCVR
jgi:hypothetical protein